MKSKSNERSVNTIREETIRFIRIKTAHYIILTVVITAIVLLTAAAVANAMQISMLVLIAVSKIKAQQYLISAGNPLKRLLT